MARSRVIYPKMLADFIIKERHGQLYTFLGDDKNVVRRMCDEINETYPDYPYKFNYLTEIERIGLPVGAGTILMKYIHQFESETCRAALLPSVYPDRKIIPGLDRTILDLYYHFRASSFYLLSPGRTPERPVVGSGHIYIAYDNALKWATTRKTLPEVLELLKCRREVYILSITERTIAKKWAPPELGEIMAAHLLNTSVTKSDVCLPETGICLPNFEHLVEQTCFNAIDCLRYYPSKENLEIIRGYINHKNKELGKYAEKKAKVIEDKLMAAQAGE